MLLQRTFDIAGVVVALVIFAIQMAILAFAVRATSQRPALYWSHRVGRKDRLFWMPKCRAMQTYTPVVATDFRDTARYLAPTGSLLRKTSLDELPQLLGILKGAMSFFGPCPALFNQHEPVAASTAQNMHFLLPRLTGWVRVNGRGELAVRNRVASDDKYLVRRSFLFDFPVVGLNRHNGRGAAGVQQ